MPGSLWILIDDIASVLDDVATMTGMAAKKTAGVLGDDLALNAQQVTGLKADREIPVVWAVAKGSFRNKCILVPAALAISAIIPWAVTPLLMFGGAYLCFEGVEKLLHKWLHGKEEAAHKTELKKAAADPAIDLVALETERIQGAIRTDFILSAEIIVITLGTVAAAPFGERLAVLSGIAVLMTVGVYGLVAGIVKLDDFGFHLTRRTGESRWRKFQRSLGRTILWAAPYMLKGLSIAGTAAMFLVGGGILVHGVPPLDGFLHHIGDALKTVPVLGGVLGTVVPLLLDGLIGVLVGAVCVGALLGVKRLRKR